MGHLVDLLLHVALRRQGLVALDSSPPFHIYPRMTSLSIYRPLYRGFRIC